MKLQTRFLLSLSTALVVSFSLTQVFLSWRSHETMDRLSHESMQEEEEAYLDMVENLRASSSSSLMEAMMQGEMERFGKILKGQEKVKSLKEMSLLDYKGVVRQSTVASRVKQTLSPELAATLLKSDQILRRKTAEGFEIFVPHKAAACMECHNEFKGHEIGGIFQYRYSLDSLNKASARWDGAVEDMTSFGIRMGALTVVVALALVGGTMFYLVRRQIVHPLTELNRQLSDGANEVGNASENIASSSRTLAEGSSAQAASTEEASAALEEMEGMTKRNAEDAGAAAKIAQDAKEAAESGVRSVTEMSATMKEINEAASRMASTLKIIDKISFQTNILALNAAVEAARAGEAGAGFAVVADEVRALALRSAQAARSISSMMGEASDKISRGDVLSEQVRVQLEGILEKTRREAELIEQIARASDEQRQGTVQITEAVHQIDNVTQKNTATSEESAAMSQQLREHAQTLKDDVQALEHLLTGR